MARHTFSCPHCYLFRLFELMGSAGGVLIAFRLVYPRPRARFEPGKLILPSSWRPRENPFKRGGRL